MVPASSLQRDAACVVDMFRQSFACSEKGRLSSLAELSKRLATAAWCAKETFWLPMPLPPEAGGIRGCLCPSCLRLAAHALIVAGLGSVS